MQCLIVVSADMTCKVQPYPSWRECDRDRYTVLLPKEMIKTTHLEIIL